MACNTKKPEHPYTYTKTPTGLQGIQSSAVVNPPTANAQTAQGNATINPAHGQPGHRCDIPVGAPMGSALPNTPTQAAPQANVTPAAPPLQETTASGGQKLNPKHGEPGHRCDIAVGAPLDSKPQAASPKTVDVKIPAETQQP